MIICTKQNRHNHLQSAAPNVPEQKSYPTFYHHNFSLSNPYHHLFQNSIARQDQDQAASLLSFHTNQGHLQLIRLPIENHKLLSLSHFRRQCLDTSAAHDILSKQSKQCYTPAEMFR